MFGHGSWMMGGWGGTMGVAGWLMMALFWIGLILLIVWLVRSVLGTSQGAASSTARAILDQRYARGELTRKEYEHMKKDISS